MGRGGGSSLPRLTYPRAYLATTTDQNLRGRALGAHWDTDSESWLALDGSTGEAERSTATLERLHALVKPLDKTAAHSLYNFLDVPRDPDDGEWAEAEEALIDRRVRERFERQLDSEERPNTMWHLREASTGDVSHQDSPLRQPRVARKRQH